MVAMATFNANLKNGGVPISVVANHSQLKLVLGNWRNEKFQLEMTVRGACVNERHRC